MWKTNLPPPSIPLTQTHIPDHTKISINNRDNKTNNRMYLLIDLGPKTPPELQLRTNIIDETPYQIVYHW